MSFAPGRKTGGVYKCVFECMCMYVCECVCLCVCVCEIEKALLHCWRQKQTSSLTP